MRQRRWRLPVRGLDNVRRSGEQERGQESEERNHQRGRGTRERLVLGPEHLSGPPSDKAHERDHHDQRARRGFTKRQPVYHLARAEPVIVIHRALHDVRQHSIGTAEGEQRRLGEEPGHLRECSPCSV